MGTKQVLVEQVELISFGRRNPDRSIGYAKTLVQKKQLGRCEATSEAVAKLGYVSEAIAAEALSKPGERVLILERHEESILVSFHLVVYLA